MIDVTDRRRAERRRAARLAVPQALAEAATVEEAAPHILQALCRGLEWDVGAFWRLDDEAQVLRCVQVWHEAAVRVPEFEAMSRRITLGPGVGLPGRVWAEGRPARMSDVIRDTNFPRAATAHAEGHRLPRDPFKAIVAPRPIG